MLQHAFVQALEAAATIGISHAACVAILMHLDLSGQWAPYSINKQRSVSAHDYVRGLKCCIFDLSVLFVPFMTACIWYKSDVINASTDSFAVSITKLACGYGLGKLWAFGVHYALHYFPALYQHVHRVHHCNPRSIVASSAWEDHPAEYIVMELPSFAICMLLFPTHFYVHLVHFAVHGWDGAAGHSGFKAPGVLGYLFDGEYHYYHHALLKVNYAEIEIIDKMFGLHHSQQRPKDSRE
jgi:hypothetical protein